MSVRLTCGDCGYATTGRTLPLAEYALGRHSCERTRQRQAAQRRARARANRSGERRDCTHPVAKHQHGTSLAYVRDGCRCLPCRRANSTREAQRVRAKLYGRYDGLVDAQPARDHIQLLAEHGIGLKQITRLSGVSGGVLTKLIYGTPQPDGTRRPPSRRCTPRVRDRILAVPLDAIAGGALVDGTGTRRRLQALVAVGWSQSKLATRLGMAPSNFGKTLRADRVQKATRDAVAALFDQIWNEAPPVATHRDRIAYSRAVGHARQHGWLPPLAWDDDTIDLADAPAVEVDGEDLDEIAVERIMAGTLQVPKHTQSPERVEAILRLAALGLTDGEIARRIGMSREAVCATRHRHATRDGARAS